MSCLKDIKKISEAGERKNCSKRQTEVTSLVISDTGGTIAINAIS